MANAIHKNALNVHIIDAFYSFAGINFRRTLRILAPNHRRPAEQQHCAANEEQYDNHLPVFFGKAVCWHFLSSCQNRTDALSVTKAIARQGIDLHHTVRRDCGFDRQSMPCTLSNGVIKKRV